MVPSVVIDPITLHPFWYSAPWSTIVYVIGSPCAIAAKATNNAAKKPRTIVFATIISLLKEVAETKKGK
jgi:hypothetical protein